MLIESPSKIPAGTTVDLQLLGEGTNVLVPARMLRADVAAVDSLGVRYRIAAKFSRELNLAGLEPAAAPDLSPRTLVDLLARILGEPHGQVGSAALRARFETELRQLLGLRDIQIRTSPIVAEEGAESIYFTVPGRSRFPRILQAVYKPGHVPSDVEFRLLKSASSLAAVVLGFDSTSGGLPSASVRPAASHGSAASRSRAYASAPAACAG